MEEIKMKDSGIKWIGKIPEDWDIKKVKYKAKLYTGNSIADNEKENYEDSDFALSYIATKDINIHNHNIDYENGMYIKKDDWSFKRAPKDSSLLCIEGGSAGKKIGYTNQPVCFVNKLCCFTSDNMDNKFLFYTLNSYSFKEAFNQNIFGLIGGVSTEKIKNIKITIPSVEEQKLIAGFLDKKCAVIDEIISKTEKQIETLEQYKKSFITESVTKGLNPHVEYKKSGIEFITKIPMHWEMKRVINVLKQSLTDGPHETPELYDDGIPFVSAEAVSTGNGKINFDNIRGYISEDYYKQCCKKYVPKLNDVYMIKSGATTGRIAIVDTDKKFTIWSPLAAFRANDKVMNAKFLYYSLMANYFQKQVELGWTYGTQQNIGMRTLEHLKIVKPPIDEQKEIVKFLDEKCKKIEDVITQQNESLETLKKYKQSLIYEYVTGKKRV